MSQDRQQIAFHSRSERRPSASSGDRREAEPPQGRRAFFEEEVERLMGRLYGTALRMTRNGADAEDLVAEALAKAWTKLDGLRDPQSFEKWIFRILTTTFISDRRRRRETPAADLEREDDEAFSLFDRLHQPFLLWWSDPERRFLGKLLRQDIERALDTLPEAYRLVVVLVEAQGFSYAEAAEALDIPVGTVRSRLSRGRSLLQSELWSQARQAGLVGGD